MQTKADPQAIRKRLGLTQGEFARLLSVTPATVARWEQGVHVPDTYTMNALIRLGQRLGENPRSSPKSPRAVNTATRRKQEALVPTKAAAAWLGVTPYTVNEWARLGRIPSIQYSKSGRRFFRQVDLEAYRAAHQREGFMPTRERHKAAKPFSPGAHLWANSKPEDA